MAHHQKSSTNGLELMYYNITTLQSWPAESTHDLQGVGYTTIADQLQGFSEIGRLPIQLDLVTMRVLRQL